MIDDASRKSLAVVECNNPTIDMAIYGMELALKHGNIKQCINDHDSQFVSNLDGNSRFKACIISKIIKQILYRIKHPQSNGKVEKFFDCYDRNREAFKTLEEFRY